MVRQAKEQPAGAEPVPPRRDSFASLARKIAAVEVRAMAVIRREHAAQDARIAAARLERKQAEAEAAKPASPMPAALPSDPAD